jgi:hypothetical protein
LDDCPFAPFIVAHIIGIVSRITIAARWWTFAPVAARVASAVGQELGPAPDLVACTAAVARSAASLRATLTDDATAISRAADTVVRLNAMLESMCRAGQLAEFYARYKAGRR